jgi:uncharacterized membrane protein HdeD (DUF308 family)
MKIFFLPSPQNAFIRGILTLAIGILFLTLPGLTLKSVVMTVGAMILLSGIFSLFFSKRSNRKGLHIGFSFQGFFNILWGLLFLLSPMTIVKVFGFFFGVIFIMLGLMQFFGAIGTLSKSLWSWIFLIFSVLLISGGVYLLSQPIESAEKILTFLGAILLAYGVLELVMAWRLKNIPKGTQAGNIVDTTYEEV